MPKYAKDGYTVDDWNPGSFPMPGVPPWPKARVTKGTGKDIELPKEGPRDDVAHDPNDPKQMTARDRRYAIDRDWRERDSPAAQRRLAQQARRSTRKVSR